MSQPPDPRTRVLLAVNPRAGASHARELVDRVVQCLSEKGLEATVSTELDELTEQAERLSRRGELRAVVAAGGDGTVAAVLNRTAPGTPLAVYPLGTENLLARHFRVSRRAEQLVEAVVQGRAVQLDVGRAGGRLFTLMASAGFDAEVVRRVHARRTGNIRHWSYVQPILAAMRNYEYPALRVYCAQSADAAPVGEPTVARWMFAFNLPCYARGLPIAARADGTDGQADVYTFAGGSTWRGFWYLANIALGRHERLADCRFQRAARLRIESDGAVPYQLDGDAAGYLPLEIEIVPRRLTLLVPPEC